MITYQGGNENSNGKKNQPIAQYPYRRTPTTLAQKVQYRDINQQARLAQQQRERDRLNKLYGERLTAQYKAWFNQWREKQNAVYAGRLYGQLNQFQSYVPPEEYQQPQYNGGSYAGYGDWGGGGGGGGSTYQAPPPEWYLQSVVWKI